ncbi:ATP synthase subunit gamma, mitochondrial-like [Orussus abietinus]|uniref:ATP synthase subunit gamma, mitochondrial-like n=1 Tax=Orussus abietinus TaxID=222816 RepID=UPI0006253FFD|nr:ATP synthase subunit gamma, mitochondrial-like [Orussus abietinus]
MSSLKVIKNRIRSVNNTKKISQTMRMVSAAKYARAERELKATRPLGQGSQVFLEQAQVTPPVDLELQLIVSLTGDRGLCGAIHSGLSKEVEKALDKSPKLKLGTKFFCVGEKNRTILARLYPEKVLWVASEVGKKVMTFIDAGLIGQKILEIIKEHNIARTQIYFNKFVNAGLYTVDTVDMYNRSTVFAGKNFVLYDMIDEDTVDCWLEFSAAATIFWMLKESYASEQSARMTSMENATKNASEMIKNLTLTYNRTRQAVITKELIEIISGASAVN